MASIRFVRREDIKRADGQVYLTRWRTGHTWFGTFMLHKIILTDSDCLHDHPWHFVSIILKGGYIEHRRWPTWPDAKTSFAAVEKDGGCWITRKFYGAGSILFRPANTAHRLELPYDSSKPFSPDPPCYPDRVCWTLVYTTNWKRSWGFWTKRGWLHHSKYVSQNKCD